MIWWLPTILLFVVSILFWVEEREERAEKKESGRRSNDDYAGGFAVAGVIVGLVTLLISLLVTGFVINHQTELIQVNRDIAVAEERFKEIQKTILSYAEKYPIEKDLLKSFNPGILLALPEIKSDSFLVSQIKMAVDYQNSAYELKMKKNSIKQALDFHSHRWFSPTFASPKYSD